MVLAAMNADEADGVPDAGYGPGHLLHRQRAVQHLLQVKLALARQVDAAEIHGRVVTGGVQVAVDEDLREIGPEALALKREGRVHPESFEDANRHVPPHLVLHRQFHADEKFNRCKRNRFCYIESYRNGTEAT